MRLLGRIITVLIFAVSALWTGPSAAADSAAPTAMPASVKMKSGNGKSAYRNFYEVLEDLLSDFEYDLKNGEVHGLKDLSIRSITLSENIPPSFKQHLELAITERIMKHSKTKVIQCLPCRARRTTASGSEVVISSNQTDPVELSRIAKISGISNFMDVAFQYQPTGMIMSMHVTEPESGGVVWSRSYNSETSRAAAFRRGVDYSQIDAARKQTEYTPMVQYRLTSYYMFERNVNNYTGVLGLGFRMVERYDNRKKEVGFEADFFKDSTSLVGSKADPDVANLYNGLNLTLLFVHAWNLIGPVENFNLARGSFMLGIGGTYASGFLGGLVRTGWEWRLAKHWAVSATLGYRPKSTAFLNGETAGTVSGMEFGVGISHLF